MDTFDVQIETYSSNASPQRVDTLLMVILPTQQYFGPLCLQPDLEHNLAVCLFF